MAISGQQNINIGLPNEAANSDSLYTAFSKTQNNFDTLFNYASPYNTYTSGTGISTNTNPSTGTVTITNTGVTSIIAGSNVTIDSSNGAVTISAGGGGGGAGVSSVGVVGASGNARIVPSGTNPVVSSGTIVLDLATTGVTAGTYTYPTLTVDDYGRINNISNGNSVGTVTSVGVIGGPGILVTGSPITGAGDITVVNEGVVRLNAGTGIAISDNTGNITISTAQGVGTVTSIDIVSSTLSISGSPVVSFGSVIIDIPPEGNITTSNINFPEGSYGGGNGQILVANGYATMMSYGSNDGGGPELDWTDTDDPTDPNLYSDTVLRHGMWINSGGLQVRINANGKTGYPIGSLDFNNNGNLNVDGNAIVTKSFLLSGSQNLVDTQAANLQVVASYFSTTGASTATLAAGATGQIKTLMMNAESGDMVITVTNPGWGGAGTITFNAVGQGCTLQYINSKWFCIGNNGATFG